jgi:hypothetical protein
LLARERCSVMPFTTYDNRQAHCDQWDRTKLSV